MKITRGGQISVPAAVRNRWSTNAVSVEDRGDELIVRPAPEDPLEAVRGSLSELKTADLKQLRKDARADEAASEESKW